eukprot:COSAG02_NODE_3129_length_7312_cov_338.294191_3_plen_155_part_00
MIVNCTLVDLLYVHQNVYYTSRHRTVHAAMGIRICGKHTKMSADMDISLALQMPFGAFARSFRVRFRFLDLDSDVRNATQDSRSEVSTAHCCRTACTQTRKPCRAELGVMQAIALVVPACVIALMCLKRCNTRHTSEGRQTICLLLCVDQFATR